MALLTSVGTRPSAPTVPVVDTCKATKVVSAEFSSVTLAAWKGKGIKF